MTPLVSIQHLILRLVALAAKLGIAKSSWIKLIQPRSHLHFGTWLPVGVYKDIFVNNHYHCPIALRHDARIVDGGANIGLSSLYFLHRYPNARIEAYEANPLTCRLLTKTLASAKFAAGRYSVHGKALHTEDGQVPFYANPDTPSALNSSIAGRDNMKERGKRIEIPAVDIRGLLKKPVDLLKLDVEGHEYLLLDVPEITPETVRAMVIEFHEMTDHQAECARLFSRFRDAGYRIEFVEDPDRDALAPASWNGTHVIRIYAA